MITMAEVLRTQQAWGDAIVRIGKLKDLPRAEMEEKVSAILEVLYGFEKGPILFKPTRAREIPFRPDREGVLSYFIGGNKKFPEDTGFALQPWKAVQFDNNHLVLEEKRAFAIGEYYFTDTEGEEKKVEYTFGYYKNADGSMKIDLHHSSVPFQPTMSEAIQ